MATLTQTTSLRKTKPVKRKFTLAMPARDVSLTQDAEWCVVRLIDEWKQIRFHDYAALYEIPGLYEEVIYNCLRCDSPAVISEMLGTCIEEADDFDEKLRVLDLGAGNGIVGDHMRRLGADLVIGLDIIPEAAQAAHRDRPGVYDRYHLLDLTDLNDNERKTLTNYRFNCMTCVAALGFGDIPSEAFTASYNLVREGGWIAFNIKEAFITGEHPSGFADLVNGMIKDGTLEVLGRKRYQHRLGTDLQPLHYVALIGRKRAEIR